MKNILYFLLALTVLSLNTKAQTNETNAHLKDSYNLSEEYNKLYNESEKKGLFSICIISATIAKFNVDTLGNIINLSFYEASETPAVFKELLTNLLKTSNGNWVAKTVYGKKIVSETFILPLTYELQAGCDPLSLIKNITRSNEVIENFLFHASESNSGRLNCTILSGLNMSSVN